MTRADATVVIGRFSPYTISQHAQMLKALGHPGKVVVVIGSAYHTRTPRDPFTWQEREAMIRLCLPEGADERVAFVPVRDYYDDARWAEAVKKAVKAAAPQATRPHLLPTSVQNVECYREWLPQWPQLEPEGPAVDDRALLRVLLAGDGDAATGIAPRRRPIETALAVVGPQLPPGMPAYLRSWVKLPHYAELVAEERANEEERAKWTGAPYEPIFSTVDCVVHAAGHVLLVRRKHRPGRGLWALPGGFLDPRERLATSAMRELHEETALGIPDATLHRRLKEVIVFDHPDRSMRGRTITHVHFFELQDEKLPQVQGSDDAAEAQWIAVSGLPGLEERLFEDHFHILDHFFKLT